MHNRHSLINTITCGIVVVLAGACATTPDFNLQNVDKNVLPSQSVSQFETYRGRKLLWGGVIINSTNTEEGTMFEILSYPLDDNLNPQSDQNAQGRFLAKSSRYLETVDYAQGRMLSIVGKLMQTQEGKIGEAMYTYPVLQIEQLHLWSREDTAPRDTRVHFGIGVIFH